MKTQGGPGALEPLEILFVDRWLVVLNKPSGMSVHRGWAREGPVALQAVRDHIGEHVHPVHRLDRGASGALLFARDRETLRRLAQDFAEARVAKSYLALVRGVPPASALVEHPLRGATDAPAKSAVTAVSRLGTSPLERVSLVVAQPRQGRLHQVRRHLKHLNHPLIGDVRYGRGELNRLYRERYGLFRLALHAWTLEFAHPWTQDPVRLQAPVPGDLGEPLRTLDLTPPVSAVGGAVAVGELGR